MYGVIFHVVKHAVKELLPLIHHSGQHAANAAVNHAATAHAATAHALGAQAAGAPPVAAMPVAPAGAVPLGGTAASMHAQAASIHAQNARSTIMFSQGQEQAAAIPSAGDFS